LTDALLPATAAAGGDEGPRPAIRPSVRQREATKRTASTLARRRAVNATMVGLLVLSAVLATLPLVLILWHLLKSGFTSVNWAFFTQNPKSVGETGGGMANAIVGTGILVGVASAIGLPIGIGAGLYLVERNGTRLATVVRFLCDVLNGLPSIVMGIFAWQFLVRSVGHFSALAGGIALAAMMIPMVTRTTEEMVRLVPVSLREAALALGYSRARTALSIVLRTATAGIVTGALVAIARIAGETAPLIFTAFGNQFSSMSLNRPIAALPLQIYTYAVSPYDDWHSQAWAGALVLIVLVLSISLLARAATRGRIDGSGD
jgi:phosphate transport system permease protein